MKLTPTALADVHIVDFDVHQDDRGWFQEFWRTDFARAFPTFVQDNFAYSRRGVLRGLHLQSPHSQGKLVTTVHGTIFDVAVDMRPSSKTFGRWIGVDLAAGAGRALYIPPGFGHGYQAVSDSVAVVYKVTDFYHPNAEYTVAWNDPAMGIAWPVADPIISEKDLKGCRLAELREKLSDAEARE